MKNYIVTYSGRNRRFANFSYDVYAASAREAVIYVIDRYLDIFPQDNGDILDTDGEFMMRHDDSEARYDGGYFVAILPQY